MERDLLHPLATLHLEHCRTWKGVGVRPDFCAVLHDTVVLLDYEDILHISTDLHSWTTTRAPYRYSSLTTYQSKFVLVGGSHRSTHELTNQLWTSTTGLDWDPSLPAMPTKRWRTSSVNGGSPEILVVAGGQGSDDNYLDIVEVLCDNRWTTAASLPTACYDIRSTFHEGNFYFTGGVGQMNILYTCSCDSLTDMTTTRLVWRTITTPDDSFNIASYSSRLIRIGGYPKITGYSTTTSQKWVEPTAGYAFGFTAYTGLAVLSTGQLVIAGMSGVFRGTLSVSTFDPDTKFICNVLSRLEAVMGVEIVSELATKVDLLTSTTGVILQTRKNKLDKQIPLPDPQNDPVQYVHEVILQWSMRRSRRPPTWRELLQVIQDVGLLELSQQIEAFMKGYSLTLKTLSLLKRKKEDGCTEKLRIIQEVCSEWKKLGDLIGLSPNRLTAIEMNSHCVVEKCCREVFNCWIEKEVEEDDYPVTWQGLCELLQDMELYELVKQLKQYISM